LASGRKDGCVNYISDTSEESYYDSDREDSKQKVLYESLIDRVCELKTVRETLVHLN